MTSIVRMALVCCLLAVTVDTMGDEDADRLTANKAELAKLQGDWTIVSFNKGGEQIDAQGIDEISQLRLVFTIKDDKLSITSNGYGLSNASAMVRLDAKYSPKLLDFAASIVALHNGDRVYEGVYSLDGDKLSWCVNIDGDNPAKGRRPSAVESQPDSKAIVVNLVRKKD